METTTVPDKNDVCARLVALKPTLHDRGVSSLALFGSVARGEAGPDSDIDLAIETKAGFSLVDLSGLKIYLEECMHRKVDLAYVSAMSPRRRASVVRDLVPVF